MNSNLAMFGRDGLAAIGQVEQRVVAEEVGASLLHELEDGDSQAADLDVRRRVALISISGRAARALAVTKILTCGIWHIGPRRFAGFLAPGGSCRGFP